MNINEYLAAAFRVGDRRSLWLLGVLFISVNGIVLFNALFHASQVGYDGPGHIKYIATLAEGRLPAPEDTREFFSPPLPYAMPAALKALGAVDLDGAARALQISNALSSLVLTFFLLRLAELLSPGDARVKVLALLLLGMLPVYYKTFSQVRGEPMLAAAAVVAIHQVVVIFARGSRSKGAVLLLGIALAAAVLSRQWGFLLLPAIAIFAVLQWLKGFVSFRFLALSGLACMLLVGLGAGWFYLHLDEEHGKATAFNREGHSRFSLANQPPGFYSDLALDRLFSNPVRPAFPNRFWPLFYSEMWGDYWCYFLVRGTDQRSGSFVRAQDLERRLTRERQPGWLDTNALEMGRYLGRVNLVSMAATAVLVAGLLAALLAAGRYSRWSGQESEDGIRCFMALVTVCSFIGYAWFLIQYPSPGKGDTIKASYMIQAFPVLALLGADLLARLRRYPGVFGLMVAVLVATALHNLPAFFSRYAS